MIFRSMFIAAVLFFVSYGVLSCCEVAAERMQAAYEVAE